MNCLSLALFSSFGPMIVLFTARVHILRLLSLSKVVSSSSRAFCPYLLLCFVYREPRLWKIVLNYNHYYYYYFQVEKELTLTKEKPWWVWCIQVYYFTRQFLLFRVHSTCLCIIFSKYPLPRFVSLRSAERFFFKRHDLNFYLIPFPFLILMIFFPTLGHLNMNSFKPFFFLSFFK